MLLIISSGKSPILNDVDSNTYLSHQGKGMRGRGPSAVVRAYDTLLQNAKDLTDVAGQLGGAAGEYLLDECSAKVNARLKYAPR